MVEAMIAHEAPLADAEPVEEAKPKTRRRPKAQKAAEDLGSKVATAAEPAPEAQAAEKPKSKGTLPTT